MIKAGGLLQMCSSGEVGWNLRQVYNAKSSQTCTSGLTSKCDKDLVYDLLEQHYLSEKDFVRSVSFQMVSCQLLPLINNLMMFFVFVQITTWDAAVF